MRAKFGGGRRHRGSPRGQPADGPTHQLQNRHRKEHHDDQGAGRLELGPLLTTALVSTTRMLATRIPANTPRMAPVRVSAPATISAKWAGALMVSTELPEDPEAAHRHVGAVLRYLFR